MPNSDSKTVPSDEDVNIIEPCFKKLKSTEETAGELICRPFEGKSDSLPTSEPFKEKCDSVDSLPIVDECVEKPEETSNTNTCNEIHERVETDIKCDASEKKQNNGNLIDPVSEVCVTRESTQTAMSSDEPESVKHDSVSSISLGEWAIKSTSFIGPSCKPACEGEEKEIEDKLSQFYKELEQIEPSDTGESGGESSQTRPTKTNGRNNTQGRVEGRPNSYSRNTPKAYYGAEPHQNKRTNRWHNGRRRPNYNDHVEYPNWNNSEPFYGHQWQPHQSFIVPRGPPYPRFNTPPFNAPPQDHFYPQDGQPFFNNNYDCNWDGSQMYDNSYYSHYDGQGACYGVMQGCSDGAYSPDGYEDHHNRNDSDFCDYGEGPWPQPFEPRDGNGFPYEQHQQRLPYEEEQVNSQPVLILLRGVPGSGKSTLAKELLSSSPDAVVLSTDDYFSQEEGYSYDPSLLGDAHEWNKKKAGEAMDQGKSPVIIDNTNTQAWEMKPYVELALERGYRVEFHEPDTSWKFDPVELEKRNKHGVPQEKIAQMLERFEHPMSIDIVLNSQEPSFKNSPRPPSRHKQRDELKQKSKSKGRHNRKRKRNRRSKPSLNKESEMITEKTQSPSESEVENSEEESLNNDSFLPEDYDVSLDWELSEAIHSQWKKSLEERQNHSATTTENYLEGSAVSEQRVEVEEKETSHVGFEKSGGMDTDKL
ncbi:NEDD4-binding protein 2-like 2 isoform X2 [Acipenser ruthenus]|uniref:NEDD4-binding protein 2-like 2 isoform X2 n=1 Tax=Acipenser ruthenus TaxID=7906 RepID=UPI00145BCD2D|nr:NEDD4-binding protein 2-like 2 isoform X2 [Acipenser ruthenus]